MLIWRQVFYVLWLEEHLVFYDRSHSHVPGTGELGSWVNGGMRCRGRQGSWLSFFVFISQPQASLRPLLPWPWASIVTARAYCDQTQLISSVTYHPLDFIKWISIWQQSGQHHQHFILFVNLNCQYAYCCPLIINHGLISFPKYIVELLVS